jgi:hypothetical protein
MQLRLLGGASSVGKTTAARELARRMGHVHVELDGEAWRAPALNPLGDGPAVFDRPAAELCGLLVHAAEEAAPIILASLGRWQRRYGPVIVEGERLHPSVAGHVHARGLGHGVFIVEDDAERLHATLMARSEKFRTISEPRRRCVAEVDRLYGQWLRAECARAGIPCVDSQPWTTLPDRIREQLG